MRTAKTADGDARLRPETPNVNKENHAAAARQPIPAELVRSNLADATTAALGLLELLAISLANADTAAALVNSMAGRPQIVALIRETQCQLNGALSDAGM